MGAFSDTLRVTATNLITEYGNPCTISKVTKGEYVPEVGRASETIEEFSTYSVQYKSSNEIFGQMGINTNLAGFGNDSFVIPWFGEEIDETWLYNEKNIVSIEPTEAQGDVIIYTIRIGDK